MIDLGVLSFDPPFRTGTFEPVNPSDWEDYSNWDPETADEAINGINDELPVNVEDKEKFRMLLPAGATVQFDYNIYGRFYVDAAAVLPVPWMKAKAVQRDGSIGITPRWEAKRLEVAMPFTLVSLRRPSVGVMLRLNSIIIGSDNLMPILFKTDAYGADFYFHLKYSVFRGPGCRPSKSGRSSSKGRSRTRSSSRGYHPCPDW